jgi:chromosomal replication initiator protein
MIKNHVQSKYLPYIENAFYQTTGDRVQIEIVTETRETSFGIQKIIQDQFRSYEDALISDYTFENFITCESNRLAVTAAREAVSRPGAINPLYIYGPVGVGKTHLLHSIGNEIRKDEPWKKIRYVEMTSFMNEFVFTVRQNTRAALESFKLKFQSYDTLLIDDIQFLNSGADKTQEEFFVLFNFLYQRKSQIVIASDRPSDELPIHERLRSRFTKGVQVTIQSPSPDLRIQILKRYASMYNLQLDSESYAYIAENISGDIRYLIGAVNEILLYQKAYNLLIVPFDRVKQAIDSRINTRKNSVNLTQDHLIDMVCEYYNQPRSLVLGKSRKAELILPRHLCMYLLGDIFKLSRSLIGRIFQCEHSTVIHAIKNIESRIPGDSKLSEIIQEIRLKFDLL